MSLLVDKSKFSYLLHSSNRKFMEITYKEHLMNVCNILYRFGYGFDHELISSIWLYNTTIQKDVMINNFGNRVLNAQIDTNLVLPDLKKNKDATIIMIVDKIAHIEYVMNMGKKESFNSMKYYYLNIFKPKLYVGGCCDNLWEYFDKLVSKSWEEHMCV